MSDSVPECSASWVVLSGCLARNSRLAIDSTLTDNESAMIALEPYVVSSVPAGLCSYMKTCKSPEVINTPFLRELQTIF